MGRGGRSAGRRPADSEAAFQQEVTEAARACGWVVYHPVDPRGSLPGWPDLTLIRPPRLIFAELKTETGRVKQAQEAMLARLRACEGVQAYLWRPADWPDIWRVLQA